jgi:hypothetical protein
MLIASDEDETDARRAKERERFADRLAIVEIARGLFEDAIRGGRHRETNEFRYKLPSDDGLHQFAEAVAIARDRKRRERLAADPRRSNISGRRLKCLP